MLRPRKRAGLKEFYFSANTSSMRVKQYLENPRAPVYFCHKGGVTGPDYCVLKFTAAGGRYYRDLKTENFEID